MADKEKAARRTAIVTGGSSGIGAAISLELASRGFDIFLTGRSQEALEKVAKQIEERGGGSCHGVGEVSSEDSVKALCAQARRFFGERGVDVLVANAGVGRFGKFEEMSVEDFDLSFATNVKGVFLWLKEVLPCMKAAGTGQIVVMSSDAGLNAYATASTYCATKWALQGMIGSLRQELAGTGVKAATINPGAVATPWWTDGNRGGKDEAPPPDKLAAMLTPEDVAKAAMTVVDQSSTSDLELVKLNPAKPRTVAAGDSEIIVFKPYRAPCQSLCCWR